VGAFGVPANPAALGSNRGLDFLWFYNFQGGLVRESWRDHSFVAAAGPVGAYWEPGPGGYGIAAGFGRGAFAAGARVAGDSSGSGLDLGALIRPLRWASAGAVWKSVGQGRSRIQAGIAVRPLTERVTLFAEAVIERPLLGVFGLEAQPVDGLVLSCAAAPGPTLRETRWTAGARFSGSHAGIGWVGSVAPGYKQFGETALYLRATSERRPSVLPQMRRYVEIRLSSRIVEARSGPSITGGPSRTLWDLLETLEQARTDRSIAGLLLWLDTPQMSLAQAEEIRAALGRFRAAGKKVLVYAPALGMGGYYLASAADRIACHPLGGVDIPGFAAQSLFLKGTLEKLDVGVQYHRHGRYKSAIETFSEDSMSAESREQLGDYLDAVYDVFRGDVAAGRSVSPGRVDSLIEVAWFGAPEAQEAGLVDTLLYYDEVADAARRLFGRAHKVSESDYTGVSRAEDRWGEPPAVAVIYAVGDIVAGASGTDFLSGSRRLGARTLCDAIAAARKERRVKAVVLRIDSPGGDGFASDLIWRELELLRKEKPLVVSMGGIAASGGYYIACNAGRVFASPTTLTGSIGVFDLGFVTEGLYNKLGARREVVKRGSKADARAGTRPYTAAEDSLIQAEVERFYRQFTQKVAAGRGMQESAVDSAGQGRIWSGSDARRLGLVDSLGGLHEALDCARSLGKVGECDYIIYPRRKPGLSGLRDLLAEQVLEALLW
ncbi:MAG: signal peptide peptidase SppA, partial [bacterium]